MTRQSIRLEQASMLQGSRQSSHKGSIHDEAECTSCGGGTPDVSGSHIHAVSRHVQPHKFLHEE